MDKFLPARSGANRDAENRFISIQERNKFRLRSEHNVNTKPLLTFINRYFSYRFRALAEVHIWGVEDYEVYADLKGGKPIAVLLIL
jgi:hypothetical protein